MAPTDDQEADIGKLATYDANIAVSTSCNHATAGSSLHMIASVNGLGGLLTNTVIYNDCG